MSLDDPIRQVTDLIHSVYNEAQGKTVKMSAGEARLSVYAPAGDIQTIKDTPPLKG
jgi:hypothetical protein